MIINCFLWVLIFEDNDVIYFIMCIMFLINKYISFNCLNLICLYYKLMFLFFDVKIIFIFVFYDKNLFYFFCLINLDYWNYLIFIIYLLILDWYSVYNFKRRYFNIIFYEEIFCRLVNMVVKILIYLLYFDLLEKKDVMYC